MQCICTVMTFELQRMIVRYNYMDTFATLAALQWLAHPAQSDRLCRLVFIDAVFASFTAKAALLDASEAAED